VTEYLGTNDTNELTKLQRDVLRLGGEMRLLEKYTNFKKKQKEEEEKLLLLMHSGKKVAKKIKVQSLKSNR
jgi:hypothetical protein